MNGLNQPREAPFSAYNFVINILAMDELVDLVTLNMTSGIGSVTFRKLSSHFGCARGILEAPEDQLRRVSGISEVTSKQIVETRDKGEAEIELAEQQGIRIIPHNSEDYPKNLLAIYDPPLVLYVKGHLRETDLLAISIIGSRRCSHYGMMQSERFAVALARMGFSIISGLAKGIDTAAHKGALKAKGRTIAVLGNGLSTIYPSRNQKLAEEIAENGAIVSEFPMMTRADPRHFPQRNRVISGLSLGVMVVEASRKSGTLTTVQKALEQGREVYALPGRVDNPTSQGAHDLIKKGAKLVTCPGDVLEELGPLGEAIQQPSDELPLENPREVSLNSREREVFNAVISEPRHIDEIIRSTSLPTQTVTSTLTILEIKRFVKQLAGAQYVRV